MNIRIGHGYDVHQLVESEPLIICGVKINSSMGSLGHSDGDVAYHSICDAILGALSLGDLGTYFPSSDGLWEDADSIIFIRKVIDLMKNQQYKVNNIDITIILQHPSIKTKVLEMRQNIATACEIPIDAVSIKATTTDGIGSIGRGEGIAASTIVLLNDASNAS